MTGPIGIAKESVEVLTQVMKAAGDNPDVRAAGGELGKIALTVTKAINNALLPLAAINYGFDKARDYFVSRFQDELTAKLTAIPPDQIVEPKASVAGPALQGLAFSHEEPDLKELYLHLLASAMDGRSCSDVHPAFVEIIKQLTAEEARWLRSALEPVRTIPIAEVRVITTPPAWTAVYRHLLNLQDDETGAPIESRRMPAIVDNCIRLGLVRVEYDKQLAFEAYYDWIEIRPEVSRIRTEHDQDGKSVVIQNGVLSQTALGQQFAAAVGIAVKQPRNGLTTACSRPR